MLSAKLSTIRIDVPLVSTVMYFFVNESKSSLDPWWGTLYSYLAAYARPDMEWREHPTGDDFYAERDLSKQETSQLLDMLKTAPQKQTDEHRTLGKSIKLLTSRDRPASLMFFRDRITLNTPRKSSQPSHAVARVEQVDHPNPDEDDDRSYLRL